MSEDSEVVVNQKAMDVLVTNIIPTAKYFEIRFDHVQQQIDGLKVEIKEVKYEVKSLSEKMDKRFVDSKIDIDKRFAEVRSDMDKRFEQVDKRFEQLEVKLDKILERIDTRIDAGLRENRAQSLRLFTFAMTFSAISMAGMVGKILNLF